MILDVKLPPLSSFLSLSAFLSVLTCKESGLKWYYNNYVQLYTFYGATHDYSNSASINGGIRFRDERFGIYSDSREFGYNYNPFLNNNVIQDYTLFFEPDKIVDKIKNIIDNNHYLIIFIDMYYINEMDNKYHDLHDVFLYGYDNENFHIGCYINGFTFATISFENLLLSYKTSIAVPWWFERKEKMFIFSVNDFEYNFNITLLTTLLKDYYYSRNTLDAFEFHENAIGINSKNKDMVFGISCYDYFIQYYNGIKMGINEFKIPLFYMFLDHKQALLDRNKYLVENGYLKDNSIISKSVLIYNNIRTCLNLSLKYESTKKVEILDRIITIMTDSYSMEKNLVETILGSL